MCGVCFLTNIPVSPFMTFQKFLRGMPELSKTMRRKKNNPNKNNDDCNHGAELPLPAAATAPGPIAADTAIDNTYQQAYLLNHHVPQLQLPASYGAFGLHQSAAAATNAIRLGGLNAHMHHQARAYTGAGALGGIGAGPEALGSAIGVADPDVYASQRTFFLNTAAAPLGANTRMI